MSRGRSRFLGRNFHQRLKFIFNIFILSLFGFFHDCTAVKEKNLVSAYLPIGEIIGRNVERVSAFYGIRYAKAPVGEKRWQAPDTEGILWNSPLKALHLPDSCPQVPGVGISEDCLFLNVVTPKLEEYEMQHDSQLQPSATPRKGGQIPRSRLLPVMIWIHGGAFIVGNNWQWGMYNQKHLVQEKEIIVVTINYRIGVLGYLAYGDLEGNYGLLDQIAAIRWVKNYIRYFGGDPDNITLMGQSAGAMSIGVVMAASQQYIKNLFHRVIMMSNPYFIHYKTVEEAQPYGDWLADELGCNFGSLKKRIECMRNVGIWRLLIAQSKIFPFQLNNMSFREGPGHLLVWTPVIDNKYLKGQPRELARLFTGPVLMGVTRDEGAIVQLLLDPLLSFYYPMRSVWSAVHYRATLLSIFKTEVRTRKILEKYPISEKSWRVNYESFTQILTDYAFYCPSLSVARKLALTNEVYFYEFNYVPDYMSFSGFDKVWHTCDVPYLYRSIPMFDVEKSPEDITAFEKFNEEKEELKEIFLNQLSNFVKSIWTVFDRVKSHIWHKKPAFEKDQEKNVVFLNRIRFTKNEERLNQFYFDRFVAFSKGQLNNATLYSQHCPTHDDALSGDEDSSSSSFSTVFGELSYLDAYWPPFNVTSQCIKLIQPNFGIRCLPKADICPLWDSIGYDPFPEGEN